MGSRRGLAAALVVAALSLPRFAQADPPVGDHDARPTPQEKETARALMDQGDERFEQKNYAGALEAYLGAHAIMRVPTTALEVAKAQEKLGHLVEARDALLEAMRYPKTPGEPTIYGTTRLEAERQAVLLGDRIPTLVVRVSGAPKDAVMRVSVDKVAVPPAAATLPLKVNPGRHHVVVASDDTTTSETDVDVAERENKSVPITVAWKPRVKGAGATEPTPGSPLRTVGLLTAGAGIAGVIVGSAFGLSASSKQDEAGCPDNKCPSDEAADKLRDANQSATVANISFIIGGVLLVGGVTMWLLAPKGSTPKSALVSPSGFSFGRF